MIKHSEVSPHSGDALIIVDLQRDFLPGGALGVARGDAVVGAMNDYLTLFATNHLPVFATRDWHPSNHCSFVAQGGPWPPHCIAGSPGAAFADGLRLPANTKVVSKAISAGRDAYSGFDGTELQALLQQAQVNRVFVGGLATDYCVLQTVRDACALGFTVLLLRDAIAAVDAQLGDGDRAIEDMQAAGAALTDRNAVLPS
ncbi:MAG TPA: isochorismatase family protein [Burkholderiaceae bacterium]|nr:isochorismatase family protein [Burkholderiaceae bacterium]